MNLHKLGQVSFSPIANFSARLFFLLCQFILLTTLHLSAYAALAALILSSLYRQYTPLRH